MAKAVGARQSATNLVVLKVMALCSCHLNHRLRSTAARRKSW